ncbi:MAG: NAD(P)-dependent oxidoreductase [Gemmatimonadota bacterium]
MTSVLVTGGGGFIGRRVVAEATKEGFDVIAVGRQPMPGPSLVLDLTRDLTDLPATDIVMHLAGGYVGSDLESLQQADLKIAENLIRWGISTGVSRWVFASAAEVYGPCSAPVSEDAPTRPVLPYGKVKLEIERTFAELADRIPDSRVVMLRIGEVYGAGGALVDELTTRFRSGFCPWFGSGKVPVSFVHVDDVARAFIAAVERAARGYSVYNVADRRPVEWREFLEHFARILGTKGPVGLPLPVSFAYATGSTALDRLRRRRPTVTRHIVTLLTTPKPMRTERVREELDFDWIHADVWGGLREPSQENPLWRTPNPLPYHP